MPVPEAFYGLEFSPDGERLFCSGAGQEIIHDFKFNDSNLTGHGQIRLRDANERGVPSGLTLDPRGETLFVANLWNSRVSRIDLKSKAIHDIALADEAPVFAPLPVAPPADFDTAAAIKRALAAVHREDPEAVFPYDCVMDARRKRLYVSLWAKSAVAVIDLKNESVIAHWATGEHPCEMVLRRDGRFLFVANANDNSVTVLNTRNGRAVETIWAALYPHSPRGSTPNSLALSPDQHLLFVANANINAVAVFDVAEPGKSRCIGFVPTGWYPTSVRMTPDGKHLLVTNGKGIEAKANPGGPQPARGPRAGSNQQYIGQLFHGTVSIIEWPARKQIGQQLAEWTADVLACSPLRADAAVSAARPANNPIPAKPGDPSPMKYCIYVIKENRTYDQVLGDMREGNGDTDLCLFPEGVTPNHHQLARDFVLLDNFYVESEVSADGHEWSMAAYASDFVEKTWPMNYGHNRSGKFPYPSEGTLAVAAPGERLSMGPRPRSRRELSQLRRIRPERLFDRRAGHNAFESLARTLRSMVPQLRSGLSDVKRAERFIAELKRFEQEGDMPRLQIVRLPNDHTHGVTAGRLTPTAYVADNDRALGMVVEAVSRSKFWPQTAIFVVEDDAQNGPDHVDAHRTVALAISPYTRRHTVDSTLYSTSSMLRTMELILGLRPMTQFDAAATPMFNSFQAAADLTPYTAFPVNADTGETNTAGGWGSELKFNFAKEDAADDLLFNEVIWHSVKGARSSMPAPVRAGFVFTRPDDDD